MALLIDLDNTVVDRDGAFSLWAKEFIRECGGDDNDHDCFIGADRHGYARRDWLAEALIDRLNLAIDQQELVRLIMMEHVKYIDCYDGVREGLDSLRSKGVDIIVVTNGTVEQQALKMDVARVDSLVNRLVVSEAVGVKKPGIKIFEEALQGLAPSSESWMVGDNPVADIGGGRTAGLLTGWVSHERDWTEKYRPTVSACSTGEVLEIISSRGGNVALDR